MKRCCLFKYYPGQKKEPSLRFAAWRTLFHMWYHARSGAISAGQKSRTVADQTCPALIEHDITRGTVFFSPRISMMVLFFIQGSISWKRRKLSEVFIASENVCQKTVMLSHKRRAEKKKENKNSPVRTSLLNFTVMLKLSKSTMIYKPDTSNMGWQVKTLSTLLACCHAFFRFLVSV